MSIETLEKRQLLAASIDAGGQDVELQRTGESIQVVQRDDNSVVLWQSDVQSIDDDRIEIVSGSLRVDSDVDLDGNSLQVQAESISIVNGGLRNVDELVLSAVKQPDLITDVLSDAVLRRMFATELQIIEIRNSEIFANQITLSAEGITSTGWAELGGHGDGLASELLSELDLMFALEATPNLIASSVSPVSGQAKIHSASATITIEDSVLDSPTTIDVRATAQADASLNAIAVTGLNASGLPATVSVGFSHSESLATIDVIGNTSITAGGNVQIQSDVTSTAVNVSRNEANSRASAANAPKVKSALNVALALTDETSTVYVGETTTIDSGGSVWIDAVAKVDNQASATTAIFKDGTVGFSGAIGVDNAVVTSQVHGTISSAEEGTSRITFPGTDVFSGSQNEEIWLKGIPIGNPLKVGEKVTYHVEDGAPVQLIDGADYFIHEITSTVEVDGALQQRVRLVSAKSLDLDTRSVATDATHTLSRLDIVRFDADDDITSEPGTGDGRIRNLTIADGVTEVVYLGADSPEDEGEFPDPIDGLVQNERYTIERVGDQIKLQDSEGGFVDFGPNTEGIHGFRIEENVQSFDPSETVKSASDYIELPENHGLQTGDFLLYNTDPLKFVTQEIFAFDANGNQLESLGEVTLPDAPVDGLKSNHGYYAIVDVSHPNRIRLAGSKLDALAASVVDVRSRLNSTHAFSREAAGGIRVTATLTANNRAESGVNLSQGEQPWSAVVSGAAQGRIENIGSLGLGLFETLRDQLSDEKVTDAESRTGVQPDRKANGSQKVGTDAAGSLAVAYFHHDVDAIIGNTATLTSDSAITVDADIVQLVKLGSIAESTRNALNEDTERDREFAVALAYGNYTNDAQAVIADNFTDDDGTVHHATLDAAGEIRVDADVIYPFLGSSNDGVNAAVTIDDFGLGSFASILDGTHGLAGLVNVYSRTLAESDKSPLSLAAAVVVTDTTNNVIARIGDGAQLNQNTTSPTQSVAVDALLDSFIIEAGHMSSFNLSVPGLAEAMNRGRKRANGKVTDFINDLVNPFGVSGKNAAGGMLLLALADHTAQAQIGRDAKISTPNDLDVIVNADSDVYNLALVQTGTGSTDFGFSAGITASDLQTDIVASIAENAIITTGNVSVTADDVLDRVNLVGAFINGKKSGIGASVGYNRINQNAAAFIGREKSLDSVASPTEPAIRAVGIITVHAKADGDQSSAVVAGALQGIRPGSDDEDVKDQGAAKTTAPTKTFGTFTLTGSVAVNDITSNVDAYLRDVNTLSRGVDIAADNATDVSVLVVGASFAIQTSSSTDSKIDLSLSGAVAINNVTSDVNAFVQDSKVDAYQNASQLSIKATDNATIHADSGGFAIVLARGSDTGVAPSAGVSVAINDVSSTVKATSTDSTLISRGNASTIIEAAGNAKVDALSIAGALAARQSNIGLNAAFGGAGGASQNAITQNVEALMTGGTVDTQTGDLTVRAIDSSTITADGGGFGVSVSIGNGTASLSNATGVGIAINDIANTTRAKIESATSINANDILVDSESTSKINAQALSASLGIAGGRGLTAGLAGAGTGSTNVIANTTESLITDSVIDATGDLDVHATDNANIKTFTLGASLGASLSNGPSGALAVGISIAKNEVDNSVRAEIADTDAALVSTATAKSISVKATDTRIDTLADPANDSVAISAAAVAATLSLSGNTSPTLSLSGGGAEADNQVLSDLIARVSGGALTADTIEIHSTSNSDIDAGVYGVLSGVGGSVAATGTAVIGAAVARNTIGHDSTQTDEVSEVQAISANASLTADKIDVRSQSTSTIDSTAFVGSFAVAGSAGVGVGASGSGALNHNLVNRQIHATIDGSGIDGITVAGPVDVLSNDNSTIVANTTNATVSVAAGGTVGGSAALGLSFANNEIANQVQAVIKNAPQLDLTGTDIGDDLTVKANQTSTITSNAIAVSVAAGLSPGIGIGFSVGGADAWNQINNQTDASIESSVITATGDVIVDANDSSTITSNITTVAVSAAIGSAASVSGAVGFSIARNEIGGFLDNGTLVRFADKSSAVRSTVTDSSIDTSGELTVTADSTSNVTANVLSGAIAAAGGTAAGAGSGAGVSVVNVLATDVIASIEDTINIENSEFGIDASNVVVEATDSTTVTSLLEGVAVAAAIGQNAAAISISIASATTQVSNNVQAKANRSKIRSRSGGVKVSATEAATVNSDASASAIAAALAPGFSVAVAGGGALSDVTIGGVVSATITGSTIDAVGNVDTIATMAATGQSETVQNAIAVALIGAAAGGAKAESTIDPDVSASIADTNINAGAILIDSKLQPDADAMAAGMNVSTGAAVGVSQAFVKLAGNVASTLDQSDTTIDAGSLSILSHLERTDQMEVSTATAQGSAGGLLLGVNATNAESVNQVSVTANLLDSDATTAPTPPDTNDPQSRVPLIVSGATMVEARRDAQIDAKANSVALGAISVGVTHATGALSGTTNAAIGNNVNFSSGSLSVVADSRTVNLANVVVGSGGGITAPVGVPSTTNAVTTTASLGDGALVNVDDSLVVKSNQVSGFDTSLLAAGIGLLTGGGGRLQNEVNSTVSAGFGEGSTVTAGQIDADATNQVRKGGAGSSGNVDATTGGVIAGVGVTSTTTLTLNTDVNVNGKLSTTGSPQSDGGLNLHARNAIEATDQMTIRSAGVAAGGDVDSTLNALVDKATVTFGSDAIVQSSGDITSSARGEATVRIQANSETYGGATIGSGNSSATILPINQVIVTGGAQIQANGEVNLSTGTNTDEQADHYDVKAYNDSFAGSAIPITSIDAAAIVEQTNDITVASGASIRSGGDLRVHAERDGSVSVSAQAKAVNWVEGVAGVIDGLLGSGGIEQSIGTSEAKVIGTVTIDGSLETGIHRKQTLAIDDLVHESGNTDNADDFTVVTAQSSTIGFTQALRPLENSLDIAIKAAEHNRREYADSPQLKAFYDAQIQRLLLEMEAQGQAERPAGAPAGTLVRTERDVLTIVVDPTLARAGAIEIRGDHFVGSGTLDAPGDALISIKNQTPAFVAVDDLVIPDSVGGVIFNGQSITSSGGGLVGIRSIINAENESSRDDSSAVAAFNRIIGAAHTSDPEIIVENTFDPVLWNQVERPDTEGNITPPGITANGAIRNLGGDVTLATRLGDTEVLSNASITVNGTIQAKNQFIQTGGTAAINAQDIVDQIDPDEREDRFTSFEVGGAEYARIEAEVPAHTLQDTFAFDGTQNLEAGFFPPINPDFTEFLAEQPTDISLYADRIFVTAEYINVNGIIQSGKEDYNLVIGQDTEDEIQVIRRTALALEAENRSYENIVSLNSLAGQDMRAFYDIKNQRIIVPETIARGGYVDLTGRITNTRNGEIRTLGGYAKISIDNQTRYDIEIQDLDVSRPGEGTVIIKDKSFDTPDGPHFAIYQQRGDVVDITSSSGDDVVGTDASINYEPKSGLRYAWSVANKSTTTRTTVYESSSWLGIDALAADEGTYLATGFENPRTRTTSGVLEGVPYYYLDTSNDQRYTYDSETYQRTLDFGSLSIPVSACEDPIEWDEPSGFIGLGRTYYTEQTCTSGSTTIHDHSIKADRPIDIRFLGADEGDININSDSDVYISGVLNNPTGQIQIRGLPSLIGVYQDSDDGLLAGREIDVVGQYGVGTSESPLLIDVTDVAPHDYKLSRHQGLEAEASDYKIKTILQGERVLFDLEPASDMVAAGVRGSVYELNAVSDVIDFSTEDFSDASRWTPVVLDTRVRLGDNNLDASTGIFVREVAGEFPIDHVSSRSDAGVVLVSQGDIVLSDRSSSSSQGITADYVRLVSETGSIGDLESDRPVDVLIRNGDVGFQAEAAQDIYLFSDSNLFVDTIRAGNDVRIDVHFAAQIYDANERGADDERAVEAVAQEVWRALQLTEELGASAKQQELIRAFEAAESEAYHAYWALRNTQPDPTSYDPNHEVKLNDEEREFYGDEQAIAVIEESRTQQHQDAPTHEKYGAFTDLYDPGFVYVSSDSERMEIIDGIKVWTEEELVSTRTSRELVQVSDTEFGIEEPNIIGVNVTINSKRVGSLENGLTIELPADGQTTSLTLEEQAAIAVAQPNDLIYLLQAPLELDLQIQGTSFHPIGNLFNADTLWAEVGFAVGQMIHLETDTRDATDEGEFWEVQAINGNRMTIGGPGAFFESTFQRAVIGPVIVDPERFDEASHLRVLRREDIDIDASGVVNVTASDDVFIGSQGDLTLSSIAANQRARVQVKVGGNLSGTEGDNVHLSGQTLVLESADGRVGDAGIPIRISDATDSRFAARAFSEIVVHHEADDSSDSNFAIDQVFSKTSFVDLTSTGNITDFYVDESLNLQAASDIKLQAAGSIGFDGDHLDLTGGRVTAYAGGNISLNELGDNLDVRHILSSLGDVDLQADGSILDVVDVVDPYAVGSEDALATAGNPVADVIGLGITLLSRLGSIGQQANELDVDTDFDGASVPDVGTLTARSSANSYINEAAGDLALYSITTDDRTAFIAAPFGNLSNGRESGTSIESGKVWLFASGDIGTADQPLRTSIGAIEGQSTSGSVYLENESDIEIGNVVGSSGAQGEQAPQGEDASTQRFDSGFKTVGELNLRSGGAIRVSENVTSELGLILAATGMLTVDLGSVLEAARQIELSGVEGSPIDMEVRGELKAPKTNANGTELDDVFDFAHSTFTGELNAYGLGGDDVITGSGLDDALFGGEGIDTIFGRGGCDIIRGGPGLDLIIPSGDADCSPYGILSMPTAAISEELPSGSVVESVSISDLDEDDSVTYRIVGDAANVFFVDGNELKVLASEELNERQSFTKDVIIEAVHAQGGVTRKTFSIQVEADNDAPRELRLASVESGPTFLPSEVDNGFGSLSERVSGQIIVGRVQVYDPEGDDTFEFESLDPRFEVVDGVLRLVAGQYVESTEGTAGPLGTRISVQVKATDPNDPTSHVTLDVPITVGTNETPWVNRSAFADVDNSGEVTPGDALIVINDLAERANLPILERERLSFARPDFRRDHFVDTNGNGLISPDDILTVLNFLAEQHRPSSGEMAQGESHLNNTPMDFLPSSIDAVHSQVPRADHTTEQKTAPLTSNLCGLTGSPSTQLAAATPSSTTDADHDEWNNRDLDSLVNVLALDLLESRA